MKKKYFFKDLTKQLALVVIGVAIARGTEGGWNYGMDEVLTIIFGLIVYYFMS